MNNQGLINEAGTLQQRCPVLSCYGLEEGSP